MIGSFLSARSGTYSVSENLARSLNESSIKLKLVSFRHNKLLRFTEIINAGLFGTYNKMHIDTFSGQAFRIAETASIICKIRRKKVLLTLHGGKLPEFFNEAPQRLKRVFARADHIQTPSLYLKDFFAKQNISVNYLPNSIDLSRFPYSRENVQPHSLLWVRAFTDIYNPDLAVRVLYEVKRVFPDTRLTMIGPDKGLLSETKYLIAKLGQESSITITGPISNNELYKYYQTHHVFINTTSYESFGVAVLEAAACGVPVISSSVGEIPFLYKDNENILMVDQLEARSFANKVMRIFESENLADKLSHNARAVAEHFDWNIIKQRWVEILSE